MISCPSVASASDPILVAAGDIACPPGSTPNSGACQQQATSNLVIAANASAVALLGDNQYQSGTLAEYTGVGSFNDTWGRAKTIIEPSPGNHEYKASSTAAGYFSYFGAAAGPGSLGYYSYNLGSWHIVSLNSSCSDSGCGPIDQGQATSAETQWLQNDLASNPCRCTLAYWHHPLFTSVDPSFGPTSPGVKPLWDALYSAHADIVLNGHSHQYERFAQQTPTGTASGAGIREFVVGTGGFSMMPFGTAAANSQFRDANDFGVLVLTLHPGSYNWSFERLNGSVVDSGSTPCHAQPPSSTTGAASSITANGASLAGTVNPNGLATTYHFDYGTSTSYGSQAPLAPDPSAGSGTASQNESASLSGLAPNTTYHYRIEATNTAGTTSGSDQTFKTAAIAPGVSTGAANVSGTSVSLAGSVNPNGQATTYHFDYGTSPTSYSSQVPAAPDPSAGSGTTNQNESANLSGLTPTTTYYYRLEATNATGTTYGSQQSFTTSAPTVTVGAPSGPTVAPQGTWVGNYGNTGFGFVGNQNDYVSLPPISGGSTQTAGKLVWASSTSDTRALESPDQSTRTAAAIYDPNQIQIQVTFGSTYNGNLELYLVDWDSQGRRETVSVNGSQANLNSDFSQGAWISWPVNVPTGQSLTITITRTAGPNAVASGIFLN